MPTTRTPLTTLSLWCWKGYSRLSYFNDCFREGIGYYYIPQSSFGHLWKKNHIENGIEPDIMATSTDADIDAGRDAIIEAALTELMK